MKVPFLDLARAYESIAEEADVCLRQVPRSGDEIITTPFTFAATLEVIEYHGATPVLVEIDPNTYDMDPTAIRRRCTSMSISAGPAVMTTSV